MRFLKSAFEVILTLLALPLASAANAGFGALLAGIVALTGLFAIFRPLPKLRLSSRLKSFLIMTIGMAGVLATQAPKANHSKDHHSVAVESDSSTTVPKKEETPATNAEDETTVGTAASYEAIKVPSDTITKYELIELTVRESGLIEVTTKSVGSSGENYAIRLVQCSPFLFGYIADGSALELLERDETPELSPLVDGSISDVISRFACKKARIEIVENTIKDAELVDETKQLSWIRITQDSVRSKLRAPSSAQFKDVRFHAYKGQTPMVCGQVNSKNAFGEFVGYQHFIGSGSKFAILETQFKGNEFAKTWNELCLK